MRLITFICLFICFLDVSLFSTPLSRKERTLVPGIFQTLCLVTSVAPCWTLGSLSFFFYTTEFFWNFRLFHKWHGGDSRGRRIKNGRWEAVLQLQQLLFSQSLVMVSSNLFFLTYGNFTKFCKFHKWGCRVVFNHSISLKWSSNNIIIVRNNLSSSIFCFCDWPTSYCFTSTKIEIHIKNTVWLRFRKLCEFKIVTH